MKFSVIVPVFNRPDEVDELLASLAAQTFRDFEVVVVEDGSTVTCEDVCRQYSGRLDLSYYCKPNSGPGQSRNYGVERARGQYVIVLDSDVVLPEGYMQAVDEGTRRYGDGEPVVAWGGPDAAHPSFTPVQKAISYAMTSFFTTGGIRGGRAKLDRFYPRSFNMGIRRDVYQQLGGFSEMRFGEDIDFSYRICEAGYRPRLFPEAWVWHKRRTDLGKFFRQVYNSGVARIHLEARHPGTMKLVHLLPALFTVGVCTLLVLAVVACVLAVAGLVPWWAWLVALAPLAFYGALIFADSALRNGSIRVGLLSVPAAFTQLTGYGRGFLSAWWRHRVRGIPVDASRPATEAERQAFEKKFYS